MNAASLEAARADLAASLADTGTPAVDYVPEQIEPPVLVVSPAEDYIQVDGTTFAQEDYLVQVDIFVLVSYRSNAQAAADLDALVTKVLPAVVAAGWHLAGTGAPGPYTAGDWVAHGIRLTVSRFVNIDPTQ